MRRIKIASSCSHGANFYLESIEAAILLMIKRGLIISEIEYYPIGIPSYLKAIILRINLNKFITKKNIIEVGNKKISLKEYDKFKFNDLIILIVSLVKSLYYLITFSPKRMLNITVNDVPIGDLIASYNLRKDWKMGGKLKLRISTFFSLWNGLFVAGYFKNKSEKNNSIFDYVITTERSYLHGIFERVIGNSGAIIIDTSFYKCQFRLLKYNKDNLGQGRVESEGAGIVTEERKKLLNLSMGERLLNGSKYLRYLGGNHNKSQGVIVDELDKELKINYNEKTVVIFLHSFDDSQYLYGVDGFEDLFEWTVFTINECIKNNEIKQILIKKHPGINYSKKSSDSIAVKKLKEIFKNTKLFWINNKTSIVDLKEFSQLVGITHHGSVAEELYYSRIPVIGSYCGPWGQNYKFLKVWSSIDDYRKILANIKMLHYSENDDDFYKFINEYRYSAQEYDQRVSWLKYAKFIGFNIDSDGVNLKNYYAIEKKLNDASKEDIEKYIMQITSADNDLNLTGDFHA